MLKRNISTGSFINNLLKNKITFWNCRIQYIIDPNTFILCRSSMEGFHTSWHYVNFTNVKTFFSFLSSVRCKVVHFFHLFLWCPFVVIYHWYISDIDFKQNNVISLDYTFAKKSFRIIFMKCDHLINIGTKKIWA